MAAGKILRARHPHARLVHIDTRRAAALPGVLAVLTAQDVEQRPFGFAKDQTALKGGKVRCIRDEIAAVAAETAAIAEEALTLIEVEYEPLPSIANAEEALKTGAPLAREEIDSNICYTLTKNGGNVDKSFAAADHIFTMHIASPRQVALAMEPRGIVASTNAFGKTLSVWLSTQAPHRARA